jgi:hypothetical protein
MKVITIMGLSLQFDADQITGGTDKEQADQALELVNLQLQREPFGLGAQLMNRGTQLSFAVEEQDE